MKKLLIICTVLFLYVSCREIDRERETTPRVEKPQPKQVGTEEFKVSNYIKVTIAEVDGCEYLFAEDPTRRTSISIIHKENCKNH